MKPWKYLASRQKCDEPLTRTLSPLFQGDSACYQSPRAGSGDQTFAALGGDSRQRPTFGAVGSLVGILVLLLLLTAGTALAQSDLILLVAPIKNDFTLILEDSLQVFGDEGVEDSRRDFGLLEYDLRLRYALFLNDTHEMFVGGDFHWLNIDSDARLSGSGRKLPGDLFNLNATLGYRRWFKEDWMVGGLLQVGSASDELFNSGDELYLKGTAFLSIPHLKYTSWLLFLNVDTDRDWPVVPGVGYAFPLSRQAYAVVGIPVVAAGGKIGERWEFGAAYIPLRDATASLKYAWTERLKTGVSFDWKSQYFNRADRRDDDDRIELNDKRAAASIAYGFTERMELGLEGGYAFDRRFGEGEDWDDRDDNKIELEDSWFAGLRFHYEF